MKMFLFFPALLIVMVASSCSTSNQATRLPASSDDVYYSAKDKPVAPPPAAPQAAPYATQPAPEQPKQENPAYSPSPEYSRTPTEVNAQQSGNTYITNNYYDRDDYYDYAYAARLRRFHRPCGWSYYDDYYTNSYWYDYNPYSWGVSIYLGYSWWAPAFYYSTPYVIVGAYYGWGNPYYPYPGGPYGYHHGYHHGGYWQGYHHGYNDAYYGGNKNPYYYNSYDRSSHDYYGPRSSPSSNRREVSSGNTVGEKYTRAMAAEQNYAPGAPGANPERQKKADMPERATPQFDRPSRTPGATTPASTAPGPVEMDKNRPGRTPATSPTPEATPGKTTPDYNRSDRVPAVPAPVQPQKMEPSPDMRRPERTPVAPAETPQLQRVTPDQQRTPVPSAPSAPSAPPQREAPSPPPAQQQREPRSAPRSENQYNNGGGSSYQRSFSRQENAGRERVAAPRTGGGGYSAPARSGNTSPSGASSGGRAPRR